MTADVQEGPLRWFADGGDALLVIPPFAQTRLAAFGPHLLQACCAARGLRVRILYANLWFAARVGVDLYDRFCMDSAFVTGFPGERLFARAAHGLPALGRHGRTFQSLSARVGRGKARHLSGLDLLDPRPAPWDLPTLQRLEQEAFRFAEDLGRILAALPFPVVGCSCSFDQINSSMAILKSLRRHRPDCITVIGGGNCFGPTARGIASLDPAGTVVDHVFEGECEITFPRTLDDFLHGRRPETRIVPGIPPAMDSLPPVRFDDLTRQFETPDWAGRDDALEVVTEASRGCLRGERGHCTFCGLNGAMRAFRRRPVVAVRAEIRALNERHPGRPLFLTDTLAPPDLIGVLARDPPTSRVHLCSPPDVPLGLAWKMRRGRVEVVEPGFEALDTDFLRAMHKGITAAQVVRSLRNLRSMGIHPFWNLLWGLPGETEEAYLRSADRIPWLHHLVPPRMVYHVSIDRDSPYHRDPAAWGIRDVRPLPAYDDLFPPTANLEDLASHFVGQYDCAGYRRPDRVRTLIEAVARWRQVWQGVPADLRVFRLGRRWYLGDSRPDAPHRGLRVLDGAATARFLLTEGPRAPRSRRQRQALDERLALELDGWFVPLARADPEDLDHLGLLPEPGISVA
ncbi:MAG TPA: RiPP maturation radical SAM C-methyltransferase [Myxococcota bacterium]|nr:RiPP maturation radical SAM C-methyltransferase [Myxococcota bacterium]HQK52230.1 RiPP maturation radical SAM C-methyltransferase [Myxococcota bacterium]